MRTVEDESGRRYLLLAESSDSSRVRDVETGEERFVENDRLTGVGGESPLATAAGAVPEPIRRVLVAAPDERALGLLVDLEARGPLPVRDMLESYDLCESDLHGRLAEFRAAGLIEEVEVVGERGYALTEAAREAVERLTAP